MRLGLREKISLGICVLVIGLTVSVMTVASLSTTRAIKGKIEQDLLVAQRVFEQFQRLRLEQLLVATELLAESTQFKAVIATPDLDHATILDSARTAQEMIQSDLLMIADGEGRLLASVTEPDRFGDSLAHQPAFANVLAGKSFQGVWVTGGEIYQVVASPVVFGNEIAGVVLTGFAINRRLVDVLEQMTNCQVALISSDRMVTSDSNKQLFSRLRGVLPEASAAKPSQIITPTVGRERFVVLMAPFGSRDASYVLARSLLARSLDRELTFYGELQRGLLTMAGIILGVALVLGFAFSNRITRPMHALVEGIRRITAGDLESRVAASSSDEVGELARAFNQMTSQLRQLVQEEKALAVAAAEAEVERRKASELNGLNLQLQDINGRLTKEIDERRQTEVALQHEKDALERMNQIMMDREARVLELKQEVNTLLSELNRQPRYGADVHRAS